MIKDKTKQRRSDTRSDNVIPILVLSQEDLSKLGLTLNLTAIVDDVKRALVNQGTGKTISDKVALVPCKERMYKIWQLDEDKRKVYDDQDLDQKLSALNSYNGMFGSVKIVGGTILNREKGLPRSESLIVLYTPDTIRPICIMRGTEISALRTGAYTAIVGEYLMSKKKRNIVACIGSGKMAETSVLCMNATLADRINEIRIYSRKPENRQRFVREMQPRTRIKLLAADSVENAVRDADYVITATTALTPVVYDSQLKRNVTVLLLGGDEVAEDFVYRAQDNGLILCDNWELVKHRNVQTLPLLYHRALNNGKRINESKIVDLWQVLTGKFDVKQANPECIFVNCVGLPGLDLEVAQRMYKKALRKGVGSYINL